MNIDNTLKAYDELLNFFLDMNQSITTPKTPDLEQFDRSVHKIFLHASTIGYLARGTRINLPHQKNQVIAVDFASILVLSRVVLEGCVNLHEIFFDPVSKDEAEYRIATYTLKGFVLREKYPPTNPNLKTAYDQKIKQLELIRNRIKQTSFFNALSPKEQSDSLKKGVICPRREFVQRLKSAGFDENLYKSLQDYLSGFVHSDSLSSAQIVDADAQKTDGYIGLAITIVTTAFMRLVEEYPKKFPEINQFYINNGPRFKSFVSALIPK